MNRVRLLRLPGVIVTITVVLDQLTKWWAEDSLSDGDTFKLLPTLEFDLAYNSGFSFSTGSGQGQWVGGLVILLCIFLGTLIWKTTDRIRLSILATILGGALGNLLDRLFRGDGRFLSGEVIDFIDVSWYAVFNVADMFVVCGCIAYVIVELREHRAAPK
ncbi:MAG: signal peptidase II [Acidimicrobiales bacterium]|nr:signal peptidase II [Acidimicrobiales bacterium]MDG2217054.1 signal peptidase II [Acidimicrobiales bacterium]